MPTNDFLPFASGAGANAISQADYLELVSLRAAGFTSGIAKSAELNKVWRQSSMMAHVLAQFISDANAVDVLDNGNAATLLAALKSVIRGSVATISASASLVASQSGMVLLNATSGNVTVTLPAANAALGVSEFTIRRTDATTNTAAIAASGSDRIMLDTTAAAAGVTSTELLFSGDYLVLRSDGAGKWWCVGQAQLPPSLTSVITKYSVAGVYTYTVPALFRSGRRRARITVTGGGGGGSHAESTVAAGGGGGGGAMGFKVADLAGVSSLTVTIGAGGAGGAAGGSGNLGSNGGTTSVGTLISATGGGGGSNPSAGATGTLAGDDVVNIPISPATPAANNTITNASVSGSGGGAGGPGAAIVTRALGASPSGAGGGGAGGGGTSGTRGGAKGADGEVILEVA